MNVYKNYKLERRRKAILFFVGTYFLIFSVKQNKKKKKTVGNVKRVWLQIDKFLEKIFSIVTLLSFK